MSQGVRTSADMKSRVLTARRLRIELAIAYIEMPGVEGVR
jgi:hypothetical protein